VCLQSNASEDFLKRQWSQTATAVLLSLAVAIQAAAGQARPASANGRHSIVGTVADETGAPIESASILVVGKDSLASGTRSDERGHFRIDNIAGSEVRLRARRLGFFPKAIQVRFKSGEAVTTVSVRLERNVASLDTMTVADDSLGGAPDHQLEAFYERARTNHFGHYVTPEDLERMHPAFTSDALRSVPGVRLDPSGKLGNLVRLRGCAIKSPSSARVAPAIWIDGVRVEAAELDEVAPASDVAAIEVYSSFAGVPSRYLDRTATCGTILVWLRLK
jgi:hypothetical protein